jgi:hypothetical protein
VGIRFLRAQTASERAAVNTFLARHNQCGPGSTRGYVAYYSAVEEGADRPLIDRILAACKVCPLHTPQAARFFAGEDWRHVYCLQRLAAHHAPPNLLSQFLGWVLREMGRDPRVWYVATYADQGTFNQANGLPNVGWIYMATNAVYCGLTKGGMEGFVKDGARCSMRCGPITHTKRELEQVNAKARLIGKPEPVRFIKSPGMHRYCYAVGTPLAQAFRRRTLIKRMAAYHFVAEYQPRLLVRLWQRLRDLVSRRQSLPA